MTNSIDTIASKLQTLAAATTGIAKAYDYAVKEINEFEMIDIYWDGATFEEESLSSYIAHYKFIVTIYIYATDIKQIQAKQRTHSWNYLTKMKGYPTLEGIVDKVTIDGIENGVIQSNARSYAFSEFTLIIDKEEQR